VQPDESVAAAAAAPIRASRSAARRSIEDEAVICGVIIMAGSRGKQCWNVQGNGPLHIVPTAFTTELFLDENWGLNHGDGNMSGQLDDQNTE